MSLSGEFLNILRDLWHKSAERVTNFFISSEDRGVLQEDDLVNLVWKAKREWDMARNNFHYMYEPGLVDYSIFEIEAARNKYIYLLDKAREQQVNAEFYILTEEDATWIR